MADCEFVPSMHPEVLGGTDVDNEAIPLYGPPSTIASQLELNTQDYWELSLTRRGKGHLTMKVQTVLCNFRDLNFWANTNLHPQLASLCWQQYLDTMNSVLCRKTTAPKVSNLIHVQFPSSQLR